MTETQPRPAGRHPDTLIRYAPPVTTEKLYARLVAAALGAGGVLLITLILALAFWPD